MLSVAATFFFAALDELSADSSFFLVASICFKSAASLLLALAALAASMVFSLMAAVFSNLAVAAYWVASFTLSWATFFDATSLPAVFTPFLVWAALYASRAADTFLCT